MNLNRPSIFFRMILLSFNKFDCCLVMFIACVELYNRCNNDINSSVLCIGFHKYFFHGDSSSFLYFFQCKPWPSSPLLSVFDFTQLMKVKVSEMFGNFSWKKWKFCFRHLRSSKFGIFTWKISGAQNKVGY